MRKTAILLALACAFARADYGPGTTDSDLLRSGTPVVTNAWLAVSNDTARLVENHVPEVDASRITDGTNTIDAARSVWQSYSGRVCTNENEAWVYVVTGQTFTASQMADLFGGGNEAYSRTLNWDSSTFINWQGDTTEFEGWYVIDGSGTAPVGYNYSTGEIPDYATDRFLAEVSYNQEPVIKAYRGTFVSGTNYVGRLALTNDIPDVSGYATQQQATNAATAVADAKISTNNAAFVSAVLAVPLTGADASDTAELAEYGGYGTVGAALLALIAGLAALKRRVGTAETALAQKANASDLPYRLVEPGEWEFSDGSSHVIYGPNEVANPDSSTFWVYQATSDATTYYSQEFSTEALARAALSLTFTSGSNSFTATRASLPGHLCDRSGNRVVVDGATTLTLPALEHAGRLRDFLVRLEISGSTVPTITFSPDGNESVTYETDGDEFPVPDEAGTWIYSFTENCVAHKFAVSLKKVNEVAQGGAS